jgi:hypothetical protein
MTTVQERPRLYTPPPPRRGVRLGLILAVIVALIAGGVWLLIGSDEPDPEPAPAPPEQTTAERNAELQAQDVAAATQTIQTYREYQDQVLAAWDISAAPIAELSTPAQFDAERFIIDNVAVEDPTFTGTSTVEVNPEPITWTPSTPRSMTLEACLDGSETSLTSGGNGPDVRFLPDGSEFIPRYVVMYDMALRGGTWLVANVRATSTPC